MLVQCMYINHYHYQTCLLLSVTVKPDLFESVPCVNEGDYSRKCLNACLPFRHKAQILQLYNTVNDKALQNPNSASTLSLVQHSY